MPWSDSRAKLTIRPLSSLLEHALLRLLDDQCLKAGIVYEGTSSRRISVLKKKKRDECFEYASYTARLIDRNNLSCVSDG